ncbi:MAG TPA: N-6 DNA methylase [Porphyromonadaceae bacterium]|nr:N-6 DNA methylase [Porphyromonadaceae bacterium]
MLGYIQEGKRYEIYLSEQNKQNKKEQGQYYTPKDVAFVMSKWFHQLKGENICDVGCGTGNLILTYLDFIGEKKSRELIQKRRIFLYDIDKMALRICKNLILEKYGDDLESFLQLFHCDFLDKTISLPNYCKVISNPPYAKIKEVKSSWAEGKVIKESKEYYASFMEKIIQQSESSVIISPYSFLNGNKFFSLRQELNFHSGFFVSFDNVPNSIFCRKYGVFNSNTSNSVRATISVITNENGKQGFRISPLIRFKSEEREKLLHNEVLEKTLGSRYQTISSQDEISKMYCKCEKSLESLWEVWRGKSSKTFKNLINENSFFNLPEYTLYFPNTCRYYTIAACYDLERSGKYRFDFYDEEIFYYCYCFLNSSFCYWFWRMYDGGITYTKGLLESMPMFYDILTLEDKQFFNLLAKEMIEKEKEYIKTKNNVGIQENIKFPPTYRKVINQRLLSILGVEKEESCFDVIHRNAFFE